MLYDGPTIVSVFNGVYRCVQDYDSNPQTRAEIEGFLTDERRMSARPHVLPDRRSGTWTGTCDVFGADQEPVGIVEVEIQHDPIDLVRANQTLTMTGTLDHAMSFVRTRFSNRHTYDGPDIYGNAMAYGRALYTRQYHATEPFKIRGRKFFIDDAHTLAVAWKLYDGDIMTHIVFGPLTWHPNAV